MRVESANIIDNRINTSTDTSAETGKKAAEVRNIYSNNQSSGRLSATNVLKGLFSSCSSLEEINETLDNMDADTIKKQMDMLSNSLTADDCEMMNEEGYSLLDMDTEAVVTVYDRIKIKLASAGVDVSDMGGISGSVLKAAGLDEAQINRISEYNIPLTEENIADTKEAVSMAQDLVPLSDATKKYMMDNSLEPTIGNVYKAEFASGTGAIPQAGEDIFSTVKNQANAIIKESGFDKEYGTEMAKWLVNNEIPLTTENLSALDGLNSITLPADMTEVVTQIADAVSMGKRPQDALLSENRTAFERAKEAFDVIGDATQEDAATVVNSGKQLTIQNLKEAFDQRGGEGSAGEEKSGENIIITAESDKGLEIKAKRVLEETRLVMTVSANYSLLKQGISIETKDLENLVEDLKKAENEYYSALFKSENVEATPENISLFKETSETLEEVKLLPSFALGARSIESINLSSLREDGLKLADEIDAQATDIITSSVNFSDKIKQMNERYETVMTVPRADLGDSIKKAFQNVDTILEDMDLETSASNERAVRILGYNSIEITAENINTMKEADSKVQVLLREMTPSVTLHMIREGINPLESDIDTLNSTIKDIKAENGYDSSEDMAEFLWQLDKSGEITDEERAGYVGVYRLLNQVASSDGAVIGALVMQGAELNMKNLLTAVKNKKASGMDITIDADFGELEKVENTGDSIASQLEKGFVTETEARTYVEETINYTQGKAMEALYMMDAEKIKTLYQRPEFMGLNMEQVADAMLEGESTEYEESYSSVRFSEYTDMLSAEEEVIKLLSANEMSTNYYHMAAVSNMLSNRNSLYGKLLKKQDEDDPDWDAELEAVKEEILKDLGEAVKSPTDMAKAQQALAEVAEHAMDNFIPADNSVTSLDIREMKLMREELKTYSELAKNEQYAIPVLVEDEMATVHLQIVRTDDDRKGRVNVLFETEALGKVAAEIADLGSAIEAMIVSQNSSTTERFSEFKEEMEEEFSLQGREVRVHLVSEENLNLTAFEIKDKTPDIIKNAVSPEEENENNALLTTQLYSLAKTFMGIVVKLGKTG